MNLRFETVPCLEVASVGGREGRTKAREKGEAYSISPGRHPTIKVSFAQRRTSKQLQGPLLLQSVTYVTGLSAIWADVCSCAH